MRAGELVKHALERLAVAVVEGADGFKPPVLRGAVSCCAAWLALV